MKCYGSHKETRHRSSGLNDNKNLKDEVTVVDFDFFVCSHSF